MDGLARYDNTYFQAVDSRGSRNDNPILVGHLGNDDPFMLVLV
jgi:hypothetical protein